MSQARSEAAGAGIFLARRMILAFCDGGDREALRVINTAESGAELGYACAYLLDALAGYAELLTGDQGRRAGLALLRANAEPAGGDAVAADAVIAEARAILLDAGDGDE